MAIALGLGIFGSTLVADAMEPVVGWRNLFVGVSGLVVVGLIGSVPILSHNRHLHRTTTRPR
jgi:hypothetical protein